MLCLLQLKNLNFLLNIVKLSNIQNAFCPICDIKIEKSSNLEKYISMEKHIFVMSVMQTLLRNVY